MEEKLDHLQELLPTCERSTLKEMLIACKGDTNKTYQFVEQQQRGNDGGFLQVDPNHMDVDTQLLGDLVNGGQGNQLSNDEREMLKKALSEQDPNREV